MKTLRPGTLGEELCAPSGLTRSNPEGVCQLLLVEADQLANRRRSGKRTDNCRGVKPL